MVSEHSVRQLFEGQDGLASASQLVQLGVPSASIANAVRLGRWHQAADRVYGPTGVPFSWRRQARAVLLALDEPSWLSHASAGHLLKLPGCGQALPVEVTVPYGRSVRLTDSSTIRVHRSRTYRGDGALEVAGLRVTGIERTLIDLAGTSLRGRTADLVVDALRRNLTTNDRLLEALDVAGRVPGAARLRRDVLAADPSVERARSAPEWHLQRLVANAGLPAPVLNHEVRDPAGGVRYEIDLAWPLVQFGIEYDSDAHHLLPSEIHRDRRRHRNLARLGWDIRHVSSTDLRTPHHLTDEIEEALRVKGHPDV